MDVNSTKSLADSQIYIVYLNSFAGTRFAPSVISLPEECAPVSYLNNYPTSGIQYECSRALLSFIALGRGGSGINPGFVVKSSALGLGGGFLYNQCVNASICGSTNEFGTLGVGLFKTTGLSQCMSSIGSFIDHFGSEYGAGLSFLGRNLVYMCAVKS